MAAQSILEIVLRAKDEASKKLENFSRVAKTMGTGMTVAGGAITGALGLAVRAAANAGAQMAEFDNILQNTKDAVNNLTGEVSQGLRQEFIKAGNAAQKFGFDNEDASVAMAKLFQRTGDVDEAMGLHTLAMDLSRAKGIELSQATDMIGMALSGNTKIFKQYGIEVDETKKPLELLAEVQEKVRGRAEAFANTPLGQFEAIKLQFADLAETIGDQLLPVLSQIVEKVKPVLERVAEWISKNPELTQKIVLVAAAVGGLLTVLGPILIMLPGIIAGFSGVMAVLTILAGPIGILIALIVILGIIFITNKDKIISGAKEIWEQLTAAWQKVKTNFIDPFVSGLQAVNDALTSLLRKMGVIKEDKTFWEQIKSGALYLHENLQARAAGGPVTMGQPYIVGERGPELFVPTGSGAILPNAGGSTNHYWNISVRNDNDMAELLRTVNQKLGENSVSEQFGGA